MADPIALSSLIADRARYIPTDIASMVGTHIAGPVGKLHAAADQGAYASATHTTYAYPAKTAEGTIDTASVVVGVSNALLRYYSDAIGSGDTITAVANYTNRIITSNATGFKANGLAYPRQASLKDRDVAVGDTVRLTAANVTLSTRVRELIPDVVLSTVGNATAAGTNVATRPNSMLTVAPTANVAAGTGGNLANGTYNLRYSFSGNFGETWASANVSFTATAGNITQITIPALPAGASSANLYLSPAGGANTTCTLYRAGVVSTTANLTDNYVAGGVAYPPDIAQIAGNISGVTATANSALYSGYAAGAVRETYTIEVIQAPTVPGDATTALLRVTSATGTDNVASVVPAAYGNATTIGTRQMKVTFSGSDFVANQTWRTSPAQAWTVPGITSSGNYTGSQSLTYRVAVSQGGNLTSGNLPKITVTSDAGLDTSGPTTVSGTTSVPVGSLGARIAFTGNLTTGDVFYVPATAAATGAYRTIALDNDLPAALSTASDMAMELCIKKDLTLTRRRYGTSQENFTPGQSSVVVYSGATATDATLTDNGVAFSAPIVGGNVTIGYREWRGDLTEAIYSITTPTQLANQFGIAVAAITPEHVLPYALKKALAASGGLPIYFSVIKDATNLTQWSDALGGLESTGSILNIVPLTFDVSVHNAYRDHAIARSANTVGGEWRRAWLCRQLSASTAVVTAAKTTDLATAEATLVADPTADDVEYTRLTCTSANAGFLRLGVQAGDIVRYLFTVDAEGQPTYSTFAVRSVINEDTLLLAEGHASEVAVGQKFEIHRVLSRDAAAAELIATTTSDNDTSRIVPVWPDLATDDSNTEVAGYFLAATLAAATSAVAPQQPIRNVAIPGFISASRSSRFFTNRQLNAMASAGFTVCSDNGAGTVYVRDAKTPSATSSLPATEGSGRREDAIRYVFWNAAGPYRGLTNSSDDLLYELRALMQSTCGRITQLRVDTRGVGALAETARITDVSRSATDPNRIVVSIAATRSDTLETTDIVVSF